MIFHLLKTLFQYLDWLEVVLVFFLRTYCLLHNKVFAGIGTLANNLYKFNLDPTYDYNFSTVHGTMLVLSVASQMSAPQVYGIRDWSTSL